MTPTGLLPHATRLGPVRLQVADLDRSVAYYESVLGFRVASRGGASAHLAAHGDDRPLVALVERPGVRPVGARARQGLFHVAYLLPSRADLGRFLRHLAALGIRPGMSDHLVSEAVYLADPDGLGIEVYADRPRESWAVHDGEIGMATEPLDVRAVVEAGGDAPWTGMPAGTVVGHVHLHVGDLAAAEAFYHRALGLAPTVRGYPGALFLSAGGYHHHLGLNTWAGSAPPPSGDDARLLDWTIVLPTEADVQAAADRLEAAGHAVAPDGRATDPWGTALRLTTTD